MGKHEDHHIGFISTRLAGMDGVSLETQKWAHVFEQEGFTCFYMAGELDHPPERSFLVEKAHFDHPEIEEIQQECFGVRTRKPSVTRKIHQIKDELKEHIYAFIKKFEIELLVPENVLCIPMNIPLGLALTEVISETGMQAIAHHHDFFWERKRFLTNAIWEYLNMAFPPHLPTIRHVVINSSADNQLSLRTGISAILIPNVMDFETPAPALDEYASDVREAFGIRDNEIFILQPTRVVARKGIEHAIELVSHLGLKAKLVISHASGDEGYGYERRVRDYSKSLNVDTLFVCQIIGEDRGITADGKKIYSLADIYPHADLVTYPSTFEGFGNAFLEAIYHRKPIVVNNYSIYSFDIKPKGFKVIEFDGYITEDTVQQTKEILKAPELCQEMVDHNYKLAIHHYSYSVLRQKLKSLLLDCF
jgi:glycosyltransferase involved in cell wall biosynthesis